jgi:hypothetical protein
MYFVFKEWDHVVANSDLELRLESYATKIPASAATSSCWV